jgi:O-antigen ligase/polysaccharide polymerase Wzy-like membrane protein
MIETSTYSAMAVREIRATTAKTSLGVTAGLSAGLVAVLWFAGSGSLLRLAIPAMTTFVGLALYLRYPILYVQYSLWVWFLAPLMRRVVDWRFGWTDPNFILLAPLLVSGVTGVAFLRKDGKAWSDIPPAFVLCGVAILYGFVVGVALYPSAETVYGLLNWVCPLLFGLHLYWNWPQYEQYRSAIGRSFLWGALVLGIYGICQFFLPPAWDRFWLENVLANMTGTSFGLPEPFLVRVWSTMNAPGPFANTIMVALLFLFVVRSPLKLPAAVAGYTSFLLSIVRTAWLSWIVGLLWILKNSKPRVVIRVVLSTLLLVACLLPLLSDPRMANVIRDRVKTFTDLGHDESFGARMEMYRVMTNDAIDNPFGHGLKNLESSHGMAVDSGILTAVFSLGWLGSILFAAGMVSLFLLKEPGSSASDEFLGVAKAIMIAILVQLVGGNVFVSVTGAMFWMMAGMYLAARKYHIESS